MAIQKKDGVAPEATNAVKSTNTLKAEEFRQSGNALREQLSEDQKMAEGSKSDKVAYISALGNPLQRQDRKEGSKSLESYFVVGHKLKALEDMEVPVSPLKPGFKTIIDTVLPPTTRKVKAGETFVLNLTETGMLISRSEYAGKFTGEGSDVVLTAKMSKSRKEPLPTLKLGSNSGSIKANMELIGEVIEVDGRKTLKLKPEFEEPFAELCKRRSAGGKLSGRAKKSGNAAADFAAAFRKFYAEQSAN